MTMAAILVMRPGPFELTFIRIVNMTGNQVGKILIFQGEEGFANKVQLHMIHCPTSFHWSWVRNNYADILKCYRKSVGANVLGNSRLHGVRQIWVMAGQRVCSTYNRCTHVGSFYLFNFVTISICFVYPICLLFSSLPLTLRGRFGITTIMLTGPLNYNAIS